jgi:ABC-type anion transport system duplicated permease subunit
METNNSLKSRKPSIKYYASSGFTKILWRGSEIHVSESTVTVDADIINNVSYSFSENMRLLTVVLLTPKRRRAYILQRSDTWKVGDTLSSYRWDAFGPFPLARKWTSVSESQAEEGHEP